MSTEAGWTFIGFVIGWLVKLLSEYISDKRLFDHRIRLEKEYGLYSNLWDKLFELRRAVGLLVGLLGGTNVVSHDEDVIPAFNACQAAVRKGEPFMDTSVFGPALKIVGNASKIIANFGKQESHHKNSEKEPSSESIEMDKRLDEENNAAFKEIEKMFQNVAKAIRYRVRPRDPWLKKLRAW